jgi:hypothetical protein
LVQNILQGEEISDVGSGVVKGLGGERALPPVSSLESLTLTDSYAQQVFDEGCQTNSRHAGEASSDVGIVQVADTKSVMPVEATNVVVRAMNDFLDGIIYQNFFEGIKLLQNHRIDDVDFVAGSYLNEAELLGIVVEAIGLSIEGDASRAKHHLDSDVELGRLTDDFDGRG